MMIQDSLIQPSQQLGPYIHSLKISSQKYQEILKLISGLKDMSLLLQPDLILYKNRLNCKRSEIFQILRKTSPLLVNLP